MSAQLQAFHLLGERVEQAWARQDHAPEAFIGVASSALLEASLPEKLELADLIAWALDPRTPPQAAGATFGDLSLIVHEAPGFVVQLLLWNQGVADIHQHDFEGAFTVLSGSSVHGSYRLSTRQEISRRCRIVDAELECLELLQRGDVRPIPRGAGLTHGIFHLDAPTISVVVRTRGDAGSTGGVGEDRAAAAPPAYLLIPPALALASLELDQDAQAAFLVKALHVLYGMRHPEFADILLARLRALEFEQVCQVVRRAYPIIGAHIERVVGEMRELHGPLADHLMAMVEELERVDVLKRLRHGSTDPEQRFMLASLLFCDSRARLQALLLQRHPGDDPDARIERWRADMPPRLVAHFNAVLG